MNLATFTVDADRRLIESLGGPAKLAKLLGFDPDGGTQRVQNWKARGIPASVRLARPDIFLTETTVARAA
ncbi:MAG: hypothetical protein P4L92_07290 [Rudaea sp.]|nr:hypothetical protein [Rudaea sp.]